MRTCWLTLMVIFLMLVNGVVYAAPPATRPTTQPATVTGTLSQPIEKDGLQVTVNLAKATFAADDPLKFTVQFRNVSKTPFTLYDVDWFWAWSIRFEDVEHSGPWQLRLDAIVDRLQALPRHICKPGETVDVVVELGKHALPFEFTWAGPQLEEIPPLKQLHPGKYRLAIDIPLKEGPVRQDVVFWTGTIKTEPVEFEIMDKPTSPATQPADASAAWKAVVAALQAGDKAALAKVTTEKGYKSIMGEEGKTLTPEEMKVRGAMWGKWTVQFSRKTDDAATANVVAPKTIGGIWVKFKKPAEGWKVDGWTPGE